MNKPVDYKKNWKNAQKSIIEYFDKHNVVVEIKEYLAVAYNKKDDSVICTCDLDNEDIVRVLTSKMPQLKSKELDALEANLDKCYSEYVKHITKNSSTEMVESL